MAPEGSIQRSELFHLLSNHRRRYALHACKQLELPVTLSDLAEQVAAWENDKTVAELDYQERRRVYTAMQQTHLPAMEDAGVIEFDDQEIELTERMDEIDVYLEIVPKNSIPWGQYYLGLSVVGLTILAAAGLGVYPDFIPQIFWGILVAAMFLLSAMVHVWRTRTNKIDSYSAPPELE